MMRAPRRRPRRARVEARLAALEPRVVEVHEQSELGEAAVGEAVALVDVGAELPGPYLYGRTFGLHATTCSAAPAPTGVALERRVGPGRQDGEPAVVCVHGSVVSAQGAQQ